MDGIFLQTVETLESPGFPLDGETWELLQAEKEQVSREILAAGGLRHESIPVNETEPSEDFVQSFEWRHRSQLEARLRALNDAQDRLIDGGYGLCIECGDQISRSRLLADPAAPLCLACQQSVESELSRQVH